MTRPLTQNAHHALVEMWGPWSPLPLDLALLTMVTVRLSFPAPQQLAGPPTWLSSSGCSNAYPASHWEGRSRPGEAPSPQWDPSWRWPSVGELPVQRRGGQVSTGSMSGQPLMGLWGPN